MLSPVRHIPKEADMSLPKLTAATAFLSTLWFAAALPAQTVASPSTSDNVSKVRIVRLSEVRGDVLMDRAIGRGMEPAITNLPIVEQSKLQTAMGVAEVEFEDNSTVRVGTDSQVEFPKLERAADGTTMSSVHVLKGTAYVSLMKSGHNNFNLQFGDQTLTLPAGSHIRLEVGANEAKLAVLDGTLRLNSESGGIDVSKKKTVTFNLAAAGEPAVAGKVESGPLDSWDKDSAGYHSRMSMVSSMNSSPYAYGTSDLSYYGSFMDAGSCGGGMMWRPYFASAAWDPYANGSWAWYGNAGYSWVSPYPWGWAPYHSGSWSFCPGMGWGWMPGGAGWMGLNNVAMVPHNGPAGGGGVMRPLMPVHPPRSGEATLVPVNQRPLVRSGLESSDSFVFRKDSAGLGIPRNTLGKLDKVSQHTMTHGTASTPIYVAPPSNGRQGQGSSNASMAGATMHRGSAPTHGGANEPRSGMPNASSSGPSRGSMPQAQAPSMRPSPAPSPSSGRPR